MDQEALDREIMKKDYEHSIYEECDREDQEEREKEEVMPIFGRCLNCENKMEIDPKHHLIFCCSACKKVCNITYAMGKHRSAPSHRPGDDNGDFETRWAKRQEDKMIEWFGSRNIFECVAWLAWREDHADSA
jgi:hypothetical protein